MLKLARGTTEIRSSQATFLVKTIKYFVLPFCAFVQGKILKVRWRHHADRRAFNWDWKSCNFNRVAAVNLLLSKFDDPIYLEIGCADNALFDSVSCTKKVGVDPASGGTMKMTSDEFFFQNETEFDVIFIDGLHTYEQVRRDVINALKFSHVNSWIALHDMLPRNWVEHHVPCISHGAWTGDVWKVAFELSKTEGIDFKILKIDRGVGIFKVIKKDLNDRRVLIVIFNSKKSIKLLWRLIKIIALLYPWIPRRKRIYETLRTMEKNMNKNENHWK